MKFILFTAMDLSGNRSIYCTLFTFIFAVHFVQVLMQNKTIDPQQCCSFIDYNNVSACCIQPSCMTTNFTCDALNGSFKTLQTDVNDVCPTAEETTTYIQTTESVDNTSKPTTTVESTRTLNFICMEKCPVGYYRDVVSDYCMKCNPACADCVGSGLSTGICDCKFGNNGSYCCAVGFKSVGNQNNTECISTTVAPISTPTALIIGSVVGGFVLIVLAIVVVYCCCSRKTTDDSGGTKSRPLSDLVKTRSRQHDEEKKDVLEVSEGTCSFEQPGYQNIAQVNQARVALHAQRQGDNIFRYAKDPTEKKRKQKTTRKDVSSLYVNKNTIKLHQNMEASNELEEIKELPVAPQPPNQKSGRKKSIKQKFSKTFGFGAKKSAPPQEPATEPEDDYLPMEDHPKHEQEVYEPMHEINQDLNDYENHSTISKVRTTQKKKGATQGMDDTGSVHEGPTEEYENLEQNQSTNKTVNQFEEQEDYENFQPIQNSFHDNPAFSPEYDYDGPQEDYENFQHVQDSSHDDLNVSSEINENGPQEDYENVAFSSQKQVEESPYANWKRK